jgi:hypothetical protein
MCRQRMPSGPHPRVRGLIEHWSDQHLCVVFFDWVLTELRKRDDVEPVATYVPNEDGSGFAFFISDAAFEPQED